MKLSFAIQMDSLEKINFATDTTIRIAMEIFNKGHKLYIYSPEEIFLVDGDVFANIHQIEFINNDVKQINIIKSITIKLKEIDVILVRQDPPFDMAYLTTTYLLEMLKDEVLIINNPTEIRNAPEKIFVTKFKDLMPKTVISRNFKIIEDFFNAEKLIVLKPLYAFAGRDVFLIDSYEKLQKSFKLLVKKYNDHVIAQHYIDEVKNGDKRIIILNGNPVGAVLRKPKDNDFRANMAVGGTSIKTSLTANDLKICNILKEELVLRGLFLVGIDVIGDYLTEINVTSPTGLVAINRLNSIKLEEIICEEIEKLYIDKFKNKI